MIDLTTHTIRNLLEKQIRELTQRTVRPEDSFDIQFSGAWLR
ncbi:MAG: hypothetical protein ABIH82_01590 [Candidatus Woesearchaeota archaeon]